MKTLLLRAWLALCAALAVWPAQAHEISMAEMQLREVSRGEFVWQWTAGNRTGDASLRPEWPDGCRDGGDGVLRCGDAGLAGRLQMHGVGDDFSAVIVKVQWLDGQSSVHTLTKAQPDAQLFGAADDRRGLAEIAWAYGVLGVEHIVGGFDHLLFVLSLLFLVGFGRRLVGTITAFTVAHSVTLVMSALGMLTLRSPPVEATIALSILLVAGEALRQRDTLARRWPMLVAFGFGLVHGLGFAGALQQIGLPQQHVPVALATFNLGVEAGQLVVVALAWAVARAAAGWPRARQWRIAALYAIGSMAAWWTIERAAAIVA
jgi:hypothetical protein